MLEFNVGEVTDRLRRFLGVRGRMPMTLDESCIGTTQLQDLDRPPFRRFDGIEWFAQAMLQTASVGNFRFAWFVMDPAAFPGIVPFGGGERAVAVVSDAWLQEVSSVTASGAPVAAPRSMRMAWQGSFPAGSAPFYTNLGNAHTTEHYGQPNGGAAARAQATVPLMFADVTPGPADATGLDTVAQFWVEGGTFGVPFHWHGNLALYNGAVLYFESSFLATATDRSRINVMLAGRFHPNGLPPTNP